MCQNKSSQYLYYLLLIALYKYYELLIKAMVHIT